MWKDKHKETFTFEKDGWFNYSEVYDLIDTHFSNKSNNLVAVEIGLWKGMSFSYLVSKCKEYKNWSVYGVDTFKGDPDNLREQELISKMDKPLRDIFCQNMEKMDLRNSIDYSLVELDSIAAASFVPNVDFLFIDGGHLREQIFNDIRTWLPKMNPGGIIAGHDYDAPGVEWAVKEWFQKDFEVINTSWVYNVKEFNFLGTERYEPDLDIMYMGLGIKKGKGK